MNRSSLIPVIAVGGITAAITAGLVMSRGSGVTAQAGADGGAQPGQPTLYQLPDGGPWGIAPDGGVILLGIPPNTIGQVTLATPTGYERVSYALLGDGGVQLGTTPLPFDCACAIDATCVWVADGGPVPLTGSYPSALVTGNCGLRPCVELSGFTGAPTGCQP